MDRNPSVCLRTVRASHFPRKPSTVRRLGLQPRYNRGCSGTIASRRGGAFPRLPAISARARRGGLSRYRRPQRERSERSRLRVLALVTEAFGGRGGIAQYNRDFLSGLARCDRVGDVIVLTRFSASSVTTLPPGVQQLRPVQSKFGYSLSALRTAITHQPIDFVFCGHLNMAPVAAGISRVLNAPLWLQVHGIEVFWRE